MEKDLTNLSSGTFIQDIDLYLCIPFEHLKQMIQGLDSLTQNESEKEHVIDILKECLYFQEELNSYSLEFKNNSSCFDKIESIVKNIYFIEEELISDYPDVFQNMDGEWWKFKQIPVPTPSKLIAPSISHSTAYPSFHIKKIAFGLFFLLPACLLFIFYPFISHKLKNDDEKPIKHMIFEHDRAYKNIFYIYSAVLSNKEQENNFYTLIKSSSFKMPEGFVVLDKNMIVDYYLKEYYGLGVLENHPDITVISVNNLNFIQCKYIITKISGLSLESIILNDKPLELNNDFNLDNHCISNPHINNTISIHIKK